MATQSGCMACHQIETKVVGPAYKEVAAKYKGDAAALDMLVAKVKNGGVGTWGQIPMPPNAHVSEDNIRTIVTWVLTH
ncbi:MAG: c-type cytochrome [Candidatus Thiodiazotropha sp.]